jgi:predicted membrane protein
MTDDKVKYGTRGGGGRIGAGIFLLLIGGVLLLDQMGFPLPDWLFSWHVLLIATGIFIGLRHNFRGGAWAILILVGGFFMIQDYYPHFPLRRFIWPAVLIFVGLIIIFSPRGHSRRWRRQWREQWPEDWDKRNWDRRNWGQTFSSSREGYSSEDFVDSTAIFGGVHKKIVSKNFKGGDVTSIMGGTELDLTQADFTGVIRLDVTQVMGGTKIIVPPHWEVRSEVTALFAGFEDKRQQPAVTNPDKVLILDGTSFFGGIELKNF